jgi:hypothetical protein
MSIIARIKELFSGRERAPTEFELADMGMAKADYHRLITSKDGTRERMEALAAQFDVTPRMIDADRGVAMELAQTCGHCQDAKACQKALDLGVDFDTARCPNAARYADMSPT